MPIDRAGAHRSQSLQKTDSLLWSDDPATLDKVLACIEILPKEYFTLRASVSPKSPEAAMMCAVLEDALHCFCKQFVSQTRRAKRLARETEEWLFNDDSHWLFSFVSICEVLGLDPNYIRRRLKRRDECGNRGEQPYFASVPQRQVA
jgi:hypothetical protein